MSVDERDLGGGLDELLTMCECTYYNHLRAQSLREEGRPGFDDKFVANCERAHELARERLLAYLAIHSPGVGGSGGGKEEPATLYWSHLCGPEGKAASDVPMGERCAHCGEVAEGDPELGRRAASSLNAATSSAEGDASAWWALVMGAAASIEDAANCLRDPDAKKQADGAAKHYREAAQKLMAARGVPAVPDCETCRGEGTIDERLGGYSFSNPAATCPDCDGTGEGPIGVRVPDGLSSSNAQWWLDHRAQIIEALEAEGLQIWSDKDRVWLHRTAGVTAVAPERDYCTDPNNCPRCKAATWDQVKHEHAGIPQGRQRTDGVRACDGAQRQEGGK